jgi:Glycosyltransferase family 87
MSFVVRLVGTDILRSVAHRRSVQIACFVEAPLMVCGFLLVWAIDGRSMEDFKWLRRGALAVFHGRSPYGLADPALLAHNNQFIYPPLDAYALVPLAVIPRPVGSTAFFLLACAAIVFGLRLLGVRDWRCLGAAFLTAPVFFALALGTIGPFLFLGTAFSWRFRDRAGWLALAVGLTFVAKLFLWPLLVWLAATRRWGAAVGAVAIALLAVLASWAGIGFASLSDYPALLGALNTAQEWKSYSLGGLAIALGLPTFLGTEALVIAGVIGCALTVYIARQAHGDERAFIVSILTALATTPLLWIHYLLLLLAPLALVRPRLSILWAAPALLWISPHLEAAKIAWRSIFLLLVMVAFGGLCVAALGQQMPRGTRYRGPAARP